MDKLNEQWLDNKPNFYFRYKRKLLEGLIEGTCLNVGCGSHIIPGAKNIDEGLPSLPYADESYDTVICSDVLEHIGPHKQSFIELMRIAKKKVIITVPSCKFLFGEYDRLLGHKRRYIGTDFSGFEVQHLFWFLVPILYLRKIFNLSHRPLPQWLDRLFYFLSQFHLPFGTTILAIRPKVLREVASCKKISVFIPLYNEKKIIKKAIRTICMVLDDAKFSYELFIVNDASTDLSRQECQYFEKKRDNIKILNYKKGPTRRENLAKSFKEATGDIIAFIDIDLVMSLRFVPDLLYAAFEEHDVVTGSRYLSQSKIKRRTFRLIVSKIYNTCIRLFFRTGLTDHMCGFKAFKREAALSLAQEAGYDESLRRGIFWDTEILVRARQKGYDIKEIPIWWRERKKSALSFNREIKALPCIIKFWFKYIRKKI